MEDQLSAEDIAGKVKCHYYNDPNKIRYFEKAAVPLVAPKYVPCDDQSTPNLKKTTTVVPPAASAVEIEAKIKELQGRYEALGGPDVEKSKTWTRPRLEIEVSILEKKKDQKPETETVESQNGTERVEVRDAETEIVDGKKKRKYTKKAKSEATV